MDPNDAVVVVVMLVCQCWFFITNLPLAADVDDEEDCGVFGGQWTWELSELFTCFCDESKPLRKCLIFFFFAKAFEQFYYLMVSMTF